MNPALRSSPVVGVLATRKWPFKYRTYKVMLRARLLQGALRFTIGDREFLAPADEWYFWKIESAEDYQKVRLNTLCSFVDRTLSDVDLVDLGADIGVVSRIIGSRSKRICEILAIEPNPLSFVYLKHNLNVSPISAEALNIAVSDFSGHAKLKFDSSRHSDHAGYLQPGSKGDTHIESLDRIYRPGDRDLLLKIDVEGQERAVFRGATKILQKVRRAVIFLEVHRAVVDRTGISPEEIFSAAEAARPCNWFLSEPEMPRIDRNRSFFEQFSVEQHDVIGVLDINHG